MGARGFQHLKIVLAQELVSAVQFIHEDLERDDETEAIVQKIFASNMQALEETLGGLDGAQMARAVEAILGARRGELYGIGSAAPVVEDAYYRLLRIGVDARVVIDSHVQAISAAQAGPGVVTLTVSHSSSTHETLAATRLAQESGATTIAITGYGRSGGSTVQVIRLGMLPQVLPVMLANTLYMFESNTRSATILGGVGAGGIGFELSDRIRSHQWDQVGFIILMIIAAVATIDVISHDIRSRMINAGRGLPPGLTVRPARRFALLVKNGARPAP